MKATLLTLAITSGMLISANAATLLFKLTTEGTSRIKAVDQTGTTATGVTVTTNNAAIVFDNLFNSSFTDRLLIEVNNTINGTTTTEGWSIKFDAKLGNIATSGWPVLCGAGSATGNNFKMTYSATATNKAWSLGPEGTYNVPSNKTSGGVVDTQMHSYIFSWDPTNSKLSLSQDGAEVAFATGATGTNTLGVISLGGRPLNNNANNLAPNTTFSNVEVYSGVIPEPATASLGLLGLGALLLRRRRN